MTANSKAKTSPLLDIINAMQTMLARSEQVTIPDLETTYSRPPNTNQSATHEDQSIHAIITERQQQLDMVLQEISGLETVMDSIKNIEKQLVVQKERIAESMKLHEGLASSFWRLPTEIMSQIFYHCLPESSHSSKRDAPLLLTRVCRRWKEVVVCIPSLWCRLYMRVSRRNGWERQGPIYDLWLKRSQGRPLSLAFFCQNDDATKIQSLLHPYINQITSLSIVFYGNAQLLLLDDLPALQELAIQMVVDEDDSDIPVIERSFWRLPSTFRSLKVVDENFCQVSLSSLRSVGAHLTNLDISTVRSPSAVIRLLHLCPNLLSLKIRALFCKEETLKGFRHTKIQTFRILHHCSIIQPLSSLFNYLSLPSLRVLEVYHLDGESCPHAVLKAFLARSKCPLESLIFSSRNMVTDVERAEYSTLIPSLDILLGVDVRPRDGYFH